MAGILQALGYDFGHPEKALPVNPHNPKGFWERLDVRDINDDILLKLGCLWDCLVHYNAEQVPCTGSTPWTGRITEVLKDYRDGPAGFIKDPRLCLTLPVWESVERPALIVLVVRHPIEVAYSLAHRKDCSVMAGLALWEYYNRMALKWIADRPCLRISFNQFQADPWEETHRLVESLRRLGILLPRPPDRESILSWFDRKLVNNQATAEKESMLPAGFLELYQHLITPSTDQPISSDLSLFSRENMAYHQLHVRELQTQNNRKDIAIMRNRERMQQVEHAVQALEQSRSWKILRYLQRVRSRVAGQGRQPSPVDKIKAILAEEYAS